MSKEIKNAILSGTPFNVDYDSPGINGFLYLYFLKERNGMYSLERSFTSGLNMEYVGNIGKITAKGIYWYVYILDKKVAGFIPFKNCILNPQT